MRDGKADAVTAEDMWDDYDWAEVWTFGGGPTRSMIETNIPAVCHGSQCQADPFGVEDVARVVAASAGENDGAEWVAVVLLTDGRYAFAEAGCGYTGWGCVASGQVWVSDTLENLWQFGVTQEARDRLGDVPPDEWVDA